MRRSTVLLGVAALLVTLMAAPALADRPFTFPDSVTFPEVNPCTGLLDEITINVLVSVHEHRNNTVAHVERSGTTDSGFTMIAGVESFVANGNVERGAFQDQWRHPDGSKMRASGVFLFNINQGELLVDKFSLVCLGNNG